MSSGAEIHFDNIDDIAPDEVVKLPFVGMNSDGSLNLWTVESTGDPNRDADLGVCYAEMAVETARTLGGALIISRVLLDMVKRGNAGAIEIGFVSVIGVAAKAGRMN